MTRRLLQGHPEIERRALAQYQALVSAREPNTAEIDRLFRALDRVTDMDAVRSALVVGCGPQPDTVRVLRERGRTAVGLEPVPYFAEAARQYLGADAILEAPAEAIPLPDGSQNLVLAEAVLEHVDSLPRSLSEMYRVLAPGGVLYVYTVNRLKVSLVGNAEEYNVRYFNWLPPLVKESYVHHHLHHDPRLANFTSRPAVHWFSFADLCRLGRDAGFHRFYSMIDLVDTDDRTVAGSSIKRWLLRLAQRSPLIRSLALTQYGGAIVMCKR